ncbi:MAG: hypothetical protein JNL80_05175 [Phycisphaerae bacterium]|nr:hypothetical protein [Phycisphaerae bacterium]
MRFSITAILLLTVPFATSASAQTITSCNRLVKVNSASPISTADFGHWIQSTASGSSVASQDSIVEATSIVAQCDAHAAAQGATSAISSFDAKFVLNEWTEVWVAAEILSWVLSGATFSEGPASIQIKNLTTGSVIESWNAAPPFDEVSYFGISEALPPASYTITAVASGFGAGSRGLGVATHSEVDFSFDLHPLWQLYPGSCFVAHTDNGCNNESCYSIVCAQDPTCCVEGWDASCVSSAEQLCVTGFGGGGAVDPHTGHRYVLSLAKDWSGAVASAEDLFGNLASVGSAAENGWIARKVIGNGPTSSRWIGFNDVDVEGSWEWQSGEPVSFTMWAAGEPNDAGGEDGAVLLPNGRWNDLATATLLPGVIELSRGECGHGGPCLTQHGPGCDEESCCNEVCTLDASCCQSSWDASCVSLAMANCPRDIAAGPFFHPGTNHRYYVLAPTSWHQAEKQAMLMGGHLATSDTSLENGWIAANFAASLLGDKKVFIGADDEFIDGVFRWQDGSAVGETHWAAGEPNGGNVERIVEMYPSGLWNDLPVGYSRHAIVELPCSGDLNDDGVVDAADLAIMLGLWGTPDERADLATNQTVDAADLAILLGAWGPCPTSNACSAHGSAGSDLPGCTTCVCAMDPYCCNSQWDSICASEAAGQCFAACQCP